VEFVLDAEASGSANMARDLELLQRAEPVVRVYGWQPACVSLGYAQPEGLVDPLVARQEGVDVVRRPTGGGALLHDEVEATYAVVLPRAMVPSDMGTSYRLLSSGVVHALESWGIEASFVEGVGGDANNCYLREEGISIAVAGRKISGGAQKRTRDAVLQHGTLLVRRDASRMARLMGGSAEKVAAKTVSLEELGVILTAAEAKRGLLEGFRRALARMPSKD
jgi:lipoate-protein ligase A